MLTLQQRQVHRHKPSVVCRPVRIKRPAGLGFERQHVEARRQLVHVHARLGAHVHTPAGVKSAVHTPAGVKSAVHTPAGVKSTVDAPAGVKGAVGRPGGDQAPLRYSDLPLRAPAVGGGRGNPPPRRRRQRAVHPEIGRGAGAEPELARSPPPAVVRAVHRPLLFTARPEIARDAGALAAGTARSFSGAAGRAGGQRLPDTALGGGREMGRDGDGHEGGGGVGAEGFVAEPGAGVI
eukprot:scaffold7801_cov84-Isochrysis_galbana.AAC.1